MLLTILLNIVLCNSPEFKRGTVYINDDSIKVEIAESERERKRGLMYRKELKDIEGMLFIFKRDGYYGFWMKNTYIPLEILFINRELMVVDMDTMLPLDTVPHFPVVPVRYVLELKTGSIRKYKIKIGSKVQYKIWR